MSNLERLIIFVVVVMIPIGVMLCYLYEPIFKLYRKEPK